MISLQTAFLALVFIIKPCDKHLFTENVGLMRHFIQKFPVQQIFKFPLYFLRERRKSR
jgi:hypothetical protein